MSPLDITNSNGTRCPLCETRHSVQQRADGVRYLAVSFIILQSEKLAAYTPLQQCFKPVLHAKFVKNAPAAYWSYFDDPKPVPASKTTSATPAPTKKGPAPAPAQKPTSTKCKEDACRSSKVNAKCTNQRCQKHCISKGRCAYHRHSVTPTSMSADPPPQSYSFLPGLESICQDILAPSHALDCYQENRSSLERYLDSLYSVRSPTPDVALDNALLQPEHDDTQWQHKQGDTQCQYEQDLTEALRRSKRGNDTPDVAVEEVLCRYGQDLAEVLRWSEHDTVVANCRSPPRVTSSSRLRELSASPDLPDYLLSPLHPYPICTHHYSPSAASVLEYIDDNISIIETPMHSHLLKRRRCDKDRGGLALDTQGRRVCVCVLGLGCTASATGVMAAEAQPPGPGVYQYDPRARTHKETETPEREAVNTLVFRVSCLGEDPNQRMHWCESEHEAKYDGICGAFAEVKTRTNGNTGASPRVATNSGGVNGERWPCTSGACCMSAYVRGESRLVVFKCGESRRAWSWRRWPHPGASVRMRCLASFEPTFGQGPSRSPLDVFSSPPSWSCDRVSETSKLQVEEWRSDQGLTWNFRQRSRTFWLVQSRGAMGPNSGNNCALRQILATGMIVAECSAGREILYMAWPDAGGASRLEIDASGHVQLREKATFDSRVLSGPIVHNGRVESTTNDVPLFIHVPGLHMNNVKRITFILPPEGVFVPELDVVVFEPNNEDTNLSSWWLAAGSQQSASG
ncbi:hypothetical protein B0H17DRAFT_1124844 [Mycena rosella]|uniref:Uncharacterized protein n=1 Tax=Mycena rosella TaxID=1033263 RepID=A0AAD7GYS0_MYCRO|nr:hypothetical protein B0H17DRAFT_1124844 [Mycena rosella]